MHVYLIYCKYVLLIIYTDPNTPSLQQLINHVRPDVAPIWYDLGVELLDKQHANELDTINVNNPGDVQKCCTQMFNHWLRTDSKASWTKLVEALRSRAVQHDVLADDLEKKFVAGN